MSENEIQSMGRTRMYTLRCYVWPKVDNLWYVQFNFLTQSPDVRYGRLRGTTWIVESESQEEAWRTFEEMLTAVPPVEMFK